MDNDVLIEVKDLSKEYTLDDGKFIALNSVSFTLNKNESIGLIGKNGSGKSTLLKIISGLIKPSSGSVVINGKINSLIEVGSNFISDLSGRENVKQFLLLNNLEKERIDTIIEEVKDYSGLGVFFENPVKVYSSGMFVRLAVSAGFHIEADIFLIDEVLMAGDAEFRQKIAQRFKKLLTRGKCLILASHSPEEILEYCSECFWLDQGSLIERKSAADAMHDYYMHNAKEYAEKKDDLLNYLLKTQQNNIDFSQIEQKTLKNDFLKIIDFNVTEPKNLSYSSGIQLSIAFEKLKDGITLVPVVKIYDVLMNSVAGFISHNNIALFEELESTRSYKGRLDFTCKIPGRILSSGSFYLELIIVQDPINGIDHLEEAYSLAQKLLIEIKEDDWNRFGNNAIHMAIKPYVDWKINKQ